MRSEGCELVLICFVKIGGVLSDIYTTNCARFWSFSYGAPSMFVLPPEAALEGGVSYVQISSICERARPFFLHNAALALLPQRSRSLL